MGELQKIRDATETARSMPHWYGGRVTINTRVELLDALLDLVDALDRHRAAEWGGPEWDATLDEIWAAHERALTERP